jgi:hypothetical protein
VLLGIAAIPQGGHAPLALRAFGRLTGKGSEGGTTGTLEVNSTPAARQVLVDGEPVAQATPARLDAIRCGNRTVGLDFGPCGVWETRVRVRWGKTTTLAPTLTGSISVKGAAGSGGGLVWTAERGKVSVPTVLDSVPIGWVKLFYEDARTPMWDRRVLVKPGQRSEVVIPNDPAPGQGLLEVESLVEAGAKGLVSSPDDTVWVDGGQAGRTPFHASLMPGLHSVRVTGPKGISTTEILELMDGSSRVLPLALSHPGPRGLRHLAPGRVWLRGPVLLSCEIDPEFGPLLRPTLHMPGLPPGSREIPLSPVEGQDGVYLAMIGPELLRGAESQAYYFTASAPDGEILSSELYHIYPQGRRPAPAPEPGDGSLGSASSSW